MPLFKLREKIEETAFRFYLFWQYSIQEFILEKLVIIAENVEKNNWINF